MASENLQKSLMNTDNLLIEDSQIVIVYTAWNASIISELRKGAKHVLRQFPQVSLTEIEVPGCIEIPFAIHQHYQHARADAYIALGCVIKGETPHFDYVCQSVTHGISELNIRMHAPVIFGILTVHHEQQAYDRLGGVHGHKGEEAAISALKMIHLNQHKFKS